MTTQLLQNRRNDRPVRRSFSPAAVAADTRRWIHEVDELGLPRYGELAMLLHSLREAVIAEAESARLQGTVADRGKIERRERLLDRLDLLIARLQHPDLYYETWQQACREFDEIWQESRA